MDTPTLAPEGAAPATPAPAPVVALTPAPATLPVDSYTARPPDAIRLPQGFAIGEEAADRVNDLRTVFEPILKSESIILRHVGQDIVLFTGLDHTASFPIGHKLQGSSRYDWRPGPVLRGAQLWFGYLVDAADPKGDVRRTAKSAIDDTVALWKQAVDKGAMDGATCERAIAALLQKEKANAPA
jgi:hypothetical protein